MADTLVARRIGENLARARHAGGRPTWDEIHALWPAADDDFVRGVYRALLGRPAEEQELRPWRRFLADRGERAELVQVVATSDEARRIPLDTAWLPRLTSLSAERCWTELVRLLPQPDDLFIRGLYELLLLHPAGPQDLAAGRAFLRAGHARAEFVRLLTATDEFARLRLPTSWLERLPWLTREGLCHELLRAWGETDEPFVRRLFELLVYRPPRERELADNAAQLRGGAVRLGLARALALGEEGRRYGRDDSWFDALETSLSELLWAGLVRLWPEPDVPFVQGLCRLLLRRPAEPAWLVAHVLALKSGSGRADLVRALADGDEGRRLIPGSSWRTWLDSGAGRRRLRAATGRSATDRGRAWELLHRLPVAPNVGVFVRHAYLEILGRQPSPEELGKHVRRLRFVPFYTRGVFVRRLLRFREQLSA
jgi:hypothetical protein